ncbi:MAG TPA: cysteine-rich CWC family protein [Xanthobacteraceae bacterium]|nr:cysteine-rich CWC family protein [Xanthobacteraceae bacterium]
MRGILFSQASLAQHGRSPPAGAALDERRMTRTAQMRSLTCARCGAAFACAAATGACWCMAEDFRLPMPPADSSADCLCPACLRQTAGVMPPPHRDGSAR